MELTSRSTGGTMALSVSPGDGERDVPPGSHASSAGRAEVPGHVPLHGGGFLLAARKRGEQTADIGSEGDHLGAAGGAEEPPAPHQGPGAAGEH